jgi:hypothetical protein
MNPGGNRAVRDIFGKRGLRGTRRLPPDMRSFKMKTVSQCLRPVLLALAIAAPSPTVAEDAAAIIVDRLRQSCPMAEPGKEQAAYESCRAALFADERLHALFSPALRWGGDVPDKSLDQLSLTHFDPRVFSGLYLSLFETTGRVSTTSDAAGRHTAIKLQARFRNGLSAGQFPYPFWHSPSKWTAYENANQLVFHLNRDTGLIDVVLRSARGSEEGLPPVRSATPPAFDGQWVWNSAEGKPQPSTSWFDGLLHRDNPHLGDVVEGYRKFATTMRNASCLSCHVPSNPAGARTLVLLQTPAHAAGEIKRVLGAVRAGKMPIEDWGDPAPLEEGLRRILLSEGQAFSDAVDHALAWERSAQSEPTIAR